MAHELGHAVLHYNTSTPHLLSMKYRYTSKIESEADEFASTWDNLDKETNTVKIEKGFDSLHTRDFTDGKTKNAKRTIIIPSEVMTLLFQLPKDTERVFHDITNNGVKKTLDNTLRKAKIERKIRFHSLRHTHASILLSQGVQVVSVSKRLGHANPTVTMQTYAHVIKELEVSDNEKIIKILSHGTSTEQNL